MEERGPGGVVLHTTSWRYDPVDRRIGVVRDGVATWTFDQGGNPILERAADGTVLARRFYGPGLDLVLAEWRGGAVHWPLVDQVGSVRDVVDDAGTVRDHRVYDSYGRALAGGAVGSLGFGARPSEPRTGFIDLRSRLYDPGTGRFLSEDPLAPFTEAYVRGNPLSLRDPSGQSDAVEYACLAVNAYGNYVSFAGMFLTGAAMFYSAIEEMMSAFEPAFGPMGGGGGGPGGGMAGAITLTLPPASVAPLVSLASSLCSTHGKVKKLREMANGPKKFRKLVDWDHSTWHKYRRR